MTKHFSQRYYYYLAFASLSLLFATILGRVELVILSLPFLSAIALPLLSDRAPRISVHHRISQSRTFEGDSVDVFINVRAETDAPILEILDSLPEACAVTEGTNDIVTSLRAGEEREFTYTLVATRRERFDLGGLIVRVHSASGLIYWEELVNRRKECVTYPNLTPLRHPIKPLHTQVNVGNYASKAMGEGIEFGDIRQYAPGDPVRRINWRASLRAGELHVNEYARERNADVVLMVDSFSNAGSPEYNTLDISLRGAAALAYHFLRGKNRVGFIEYGGGFRWVTPSLGMRQWYKILEHLTDVQTRFSYTSKDLATVPRRILPPQALVLAITPLIDRRFKEALLNLLSRGFDTVAIAISPAKTIRKAIGETPIHRVALKLWELEHEGEVGSLRNIGLAVLEWDPEEPLELLARSVDALRRRRGR
ncbi:MAG: DUF58 domain-containing protein [bacterium]